MHCLIAHLPEHGTEIPELTNGDDFYDTIRTGELNLRKHCLRRWCPARQARPATLYAIQGIMINFEKSLAFKPRN